MSAAFRAVAGNIDSKVGGVEGETVSRDGESIAVDVGYT